MTDTTPTHPSLLLRIRDSGDRKAWSEFVDVYAPLVYGFARKHGLQDADAADLTQEVLHAVSAAISKLDYDPQRGTFRGWLFTVVRRRLENAVKRQHRECRGCGGTSAHVALEAIPAQEEQQADWEKEYEARLFSCASASVRAEMLESTWRAFWLTAIEGKTGKEASVVLGMTAAAVYLAKRRVLARLKETIRRLEGEAGSSALDTSGRGV
jgi:RNA polymerase sigma-70 factor (ECF subfamily)